jgi:hypothetical protein
LDLGWFELTLICAVAFGAVWYGQSEEDKRKDLDDLAWAVSLPKRLLLALLRRLLRL